MSDERMIDLCVRTGRSVLDKGDGEITASQLRCVANDQGFCEPYATRTGHEAFRRLMQERQKHEWRLGKDRWGETALLSKESVRQEA